MLFNPLQLGHTAGPELLLSEIIITNISCITLFSVRALANSSSLCSRHVFWLYNQDCLFKTSIFLILVVLHLVS